MGRYNAIIPKKDEMESVQLLLGPLYINSSDPYLLMLKQQLEEEGNRSESSEFSAEQWEKVSMSTKQAFNNLTLY